MLIFRYFPLITRSPYGRRRHYSICADSTMRIRNELGYLELIESKNKERLRNTNLIHARPGGHFTYGLHLPHAGEGVHPPIGTVGNPTAGGRVHVPIGPLEQYPLYIIIKNAL